MAELTRHTNVKAMDAETLEALKGSIAKWEGIVAGTTRDHGAYNCPLCQMFVRKSECRGCPVAEHTGQRQCRGTPYYEVIDGDKATEQAMLDFLKALLPDETVTGENHGS